MKQKVVTKEIIGNLKIKYLLKADSDRQVDLSFIHHLPNTSSDIDLLVIATGGASVVVNATVTIEPQSVNSQTKLSIITLSDNDSTVTASPNLEIYNNQVQASHSLSTVKLSDEELFYLASRGIDRESSRQLVINNLLSKFQNAIML